MSTRVGTWWKAHGALAGAGAGNNEGGSGRCGDGGKLLFIEFARVVNVQPDLLIERLDDIFVRHGGPLKRQTMVG